MRSPRDGAPCGPQGALDNGIGFREGTAPRGRDHGEGVPPEPIPNSAVKPLIAESTAVETVGG